MGILEHHPDGFVLHVAEAHKSLLSAPKSAALPLLPGSRVLFAAKTRADLVRGLLVAWEKGALPILASDGRAPVESEAPGHPPEEPPTSPDEYVASQELRFHPTDPLAELSTSGSTGAPRLFAKNARQLFGEAFALKEILPLSSEDVVLATTASHHLYGLLFGVLAPWAAGAAIIASPENEPGRFHPEKIATLAKAHGATHLISVPAHLRALLQANVTLPTVHTIVSSAAPLAAEDALRLEEKFGARVIDVLGSTETGGLATRRAASPAIWTPLPGVRVQLDDESRLLLSSPFLSDPHIEERSEERALIHADGTFEYLGRADMVVKVGGKRIDLREIEVLVDALPGVTDVACLSKKVSQLRGEEILLVVATKSWNKEGLRAALLEKCDRAFLPRKIRILERLPRDERGKLKRDELLRLFEGAENEPPANDHVQNKPTQNEPAQNKPARVERNVTVPADFRRFSGHFEGDPLLPALSQLSDIILPEMRRAFGGGSLASLRRVKWTQAIRPGAELSLHLEKKSQGITFQIFLGETLACSGTAVLHPEGS